MAALPGPNRSIRPTAVRETLRRLTWPYATAFGTPWHRFNWVFAPHCPWVRQWKHRYREDPDRVATWIDIGHRFEAHRHSPGCPHPHSVSSNTGHLQDTYPIGGRNRIDCCRGGKRFASMTGLSVTFWARSSAFWGLLEDGFDDIGPDVLGENQRSSLAGRSCSPAIPSRHGLFGQPGGNCSRPAPLVGVNGAFIMCKILYSCCTVPLQLHEGSLAPEEGPSSGQGQSHWLPAGSKRRSGGGGVWVEVSVELSHHLRCRALFAYVVFSFVQVALCATLQNVQVHQRNKKSASMTLSVDLSGANERQCTSVRRQDEMILSRFPPDAQPRQTIQSQINTKEAGTGLLATKAREFELRMLHKSRDVQLFGS